MVTAADLQQTPVDFPGQEAVRVSHEAIYQALFVQAKGQLKARLVGHLRTQGRGKVATSRR